MKRLVIAILCAAAAGLFLPRETLARGHDGFYFGVGPLTIPMVSNDRRLTAPGGFSERLKFLPGIGAWVLVGYDFPDTSWGIQMPVEWQYFRLNRQEWVNSIGGNVEGVWRFAQWANGCEFHLIGGLGATHLFEGAMSNNTASTGFNVSVGPGFAWFFARGDTRASLTVEVPFRYIYFFGDNLSHNGAHVFAFPVRVGVTIGF